MSKSIKAADILPFLAECFPHAFTVEQYLPHQPLRIGIDGDLAERCPAIDRFERMAVLRYYCTRPMYLRACIEGAVRVDLDGNPAGVVTAAEAAFAAARLVEALAEREARRAAREPAAAPTPSSKPAPASKSPTSKPASPAMSTVSTRVQRPLLRLPAFRGPR
jgi:ProP effector